MKVYTKGGDKGETSLVSGKRISKADDRIDLYGEVDELNSFIGLLRVGVKNEILANIQNSLFNLGSLLACPFEKWDTYKLTKLDDSLIQRIENEIDEMNVKLPNLKNFILPGGSEDASRAHVCRTVTRRVERKLVGLNQLDPRSIPLYSIELLNRLSDYFFVLSRFLNFEKGEKEVLWEP